MSIAQPYEPFLRDKQRRLSRQQQRWPTAGWVLGEARWYLFGMAGGAATAFAAFAVWLLSHIAWPTPVLIRVGVVLFISSAGLGVVTWILRRGLWRPRSSRKQQQRH